MCSNKYDFGLDLYDSNESNALILKQITPNSIILEFGPYMGRMSSILKNSFNCSVYGVELDAEAAKVCSQYMTELVVGDIEDYIWVDEFKDIQFDYIIFADVLEHLRSPEDVLKKAKNLLKFGGSILLSVPNITHNSIIVNMFNNKFNYTDVGLLDKTHIHFWGYDNLIEMIYRIGMVPVFQTATYCGMDNEVGTSYKNIPFEMQQSLLDRNYGHVYQFVFQIYNANYVKQKELDVMKEIRSNSAYSGKIMCTAITEGYKAGDWYKTYPIYLNADINLEIDVKGLGKIDRFDIEIQGEASGIFSIALFGKTIKDETKLLIENLGKDDIEYQYFVKENENKRLYCNVGGREYDTIVVKISKVLINRNLLADMWSQKCASDKRTAETITGYNKQVLGLEEKIQLQETELKKYAKELEDKNMLLKAQKDEIEKCQKEIWEKNTLLKGKDKELVQIKNALEDIKKRIEELKIKNTENKLIKKLSWLKDYILITIRLYAFHPVKFFKKVYSLLVCKKNTNINFEKIEDNQVIQDMVSVVIPIYNRTFELRESIESILNQTYSNFELILVCDGSPKETLEVVDSYSRNPKVRIFKYYNNSGNAVRGRNKAIKEARGVYLAFQDSDDIAEPDRLEKSVAYMKKYDVDVVYGGWRAKVDGSRKIDLQDGQEVFSPDCDYDMLKQICVPCQSTVMVKLEALKDVGGLKTKMRYREDHELWLRLAWFGYKFKAIPEILTNLRLHENNLELKFKDDDAHWEELTMKEHKIKGKLPIKIGYIIAGCGISGGLSVICTHVNKLLERGFDVTLICTGDIKPIDWYPNQRVEIVPLNKISNNYDVLVATYWMTAYTLEKLQAHKKIYFIQSDERKFYETNSREWEMVHKTYQMDFVWITMANWIRQWLEKEFKKKAVVIHNGIDPKIMYESEPLEPRDEKVRVLVEGPSTIAFKGVDKSFKILEGLDCEVWYVSSDGKPKKEWKYDRFFEKVPLENMKEIYSSCDILLKMSEVESFCLPALEIMACGGIPIVARVNGVDEFLVNEKNGYLVEQGDLETPREILLDLMNNRKKLEELKEEARKTAKMWNWDRFIDVLDNVLIE